MAPKRCLIVSIKRKHKLHANIVAQLQAAGYAPEEFPLPAEDTGKCSIESDIVANSTNVDLIVVYLTVDVSANVCVGTLVKQAEKHGIRLVALWVDDVVADSVPRPVDSFSDAVTPYTDTLADVFLGKENPWMLPNGDEPPKRKIKKHTCG
jgi:hypothetical protein